MSDKAKLPVFDTLVEAFKYPATHFFQVLKVITLPFVMIYGPLLVLGWWALDTLLPELATLIESAGETGDDETFEAVFASRGLGALNGLSQLANLAGLLFAAMITVPLTRAIVADETPGLFRLDRAVWWYALGQIVYALVIIGIVLSAMLLAISAVAMAGEDADLATAGIVVTAVFVCFFVIIRLSVFLPEVAMTGRFGFRASFAMTRGNVWRIVGLVVLLIIAWLMLTMAMMAVFFGVGAVLFGSDIAALGSSAAGGDPELTAAWFKETFVTPAGGLMALIYVIFAVYYTGFSIALPAFMYKALEGNRRETS